MSRKSAPALKGGDTRGRRYAGTGKCDELHGKCLRFMVHCGQDGRRRNGFAGTAPTERGGRPIFRPIIPPSGKRFNVYDADLPALRAACRVWRGPSRGSCRQSRLKVRIEVRNRKQLLTKPEGYPIIESYRY
jgi:hypothetical protein